MKLGIHAGPQDLSMADLKRLWKAGDENGFHWISVWDHFYANPLQTRENPCFEGVASMAGLATYTQNVRVGCLVFCALFRNPGVLAKAGVTIVAGSLMPNAANTSFGTSFRSCSSCSGPAPASVGQNAIVAAVTAQSAAVQIQIVTRRSQSSLP